MFAIYDRSRSSILDPVFKTLEEAEQQLELQIIDHYNKTVEDLDSEINDLSVDVAGFKEFQLRQKQPKKQVINKPKTKKKKSKKQESDSDSDGSKSEASDVLCITDEYIGCYGTLEQVNDLLIVKQMEAENRFGILTQSKSNFSLVEIKILVNI